MSETNGFADRDSLLKNTARRFGVYPLPSGGKVRVRNLTELERQEYELAALDRKGQLVREGLRTSKCRLIVLCVVDGEGNPILSDADIPVLQQQDSLITNALADICQSHCGISDADLESLEKNSAEIADDDSHST